MQIQFRKKTKIDGFGTFRCNDILRVRCIKLLSNQPNEVQVDIMLDEKRGRIAILSRDSILVKL